MTVDYTLYEASSEPVVVRFTEVKMKNGKQRHDYKVMSPAIYAGRKEGVTATFNFVAKPELIQWAANMAVQAIANGADNHTAKYAHLTMKEAAGDIGTRVHAWIEAHFKGEDLPIEDDMKASVDGFLEWESRTKPETLFSERVVFSKSFDYAGKLDWGGMINGRYGLIDFKTGSCDKEFDVRLKRYTGKVRARTEHFIQNGGYDQALIDEDGDRAEFYGVLYIPVDGRVEYFETTDTDQYRETFIQTLQTKRMWKDGIYLNKFRRRSVYANT